MHTQVVLTFSAFKDLIEVPEANRAEVLIDLSFVSIEWPLIYTLSIELLMYNIPLLGRLCFSR